MGSTPRSHRYQCSECERPARARGYCTGHYAKWRYANKREQKLAGTNRARQARYRRRRIEWLTQLGAWCVKCGTTADLTFDHIDYRTKVADPATVLEGWAEGRVASEMVKCQVLCRGCNTGKSNKEKPRRGSYAKTT